MKEGTETSQNSSGSVTKRKGLFGLRNEKFDEEEHDNQILNMLKESGKANQSGLSNSS